jgi:hypothetical protein
MRDGVLAIASAAVRHVKDVSLAVEPGVPDALSGCLKCRRGSIAGEASEAVTISAGVDLRLRRRSEERVRWVRRWSRASRGATLFREHDDGDEGGAPSVRAPDHPRHH